MSFETFPPRGNSIMFYRLGSFHGLAKDRPRLVAFNLVRAAAYMIGLCAITDASNIVDDNELSIHTAKLIKRLPEFEGIVEKQQTQTNVRTPIQMVVDAIDHSQWVTINSFEQILYDETDKVIEDPGNLNGYWPYPGFSSHQIDVGYGRKSVTRISGHFYDVWITDP